MSVAVKQPDGGADRRERVLELAQPKELRSIWITSFGPRVQWGTQETLWPLSSAALMAKATPRLDDLSQPKKYFPKTNQAEYMFSCGRPSVIWDGQSELKNFNPSERITQLALPKKVPRAFLEDRPIYEYSCGRTSAIWRVTSAAKASQGNPRTEVLARPKSVHSDYRYPREVKTSVPQSALLARPSSRLESLAVAKAKDDGPFRDPIWLVSRGAKNASPSSRALELARPKALAEGYNPAREVIWDVPKAAQKTMATNRLSELSTPIVRATMDHVQFDPDAFLVKSSALKGKCTNRTQELAQPTRRV